MNFADWAGPPGEPGLVVDLRVPGALGELLTRYGAARPRVLANVLAHAYGLGAQMAVIEYRYLDADYRNEHSRFYSGTFRRYPSIAHRIHFFSTAPPAELDDEDVPAMFPPDAYLGFCVVRPVSGAPVGRTMLPPPDELAPYVSCQSEDHVNLFGTPLRIRGVPFMAQDAQLSVCAHASLWIVARYHTERFGAPKFLPSDIADVVPAAVGLGRPTPSLGLTIHQMLEASRLIGLPCLLYDIQRSAAAKESMYSLTCRYLNSGIPVIIAGGGHAFTLIGYQPYRSHDGSKLIRYIRQDDEVGPYQVVNNPNLDDYHPWKYLIVPLPTKIYVSGEKAEALGRERILSTLRSISSSDASTLLHRIETGEVKVRTTVTLSNDFKSGLLKRGLDATATAIYQRMPMSRWIWVVELTEVADRDVGAPCVVAEAVVDATDHLRDLHVLAWRVLDTLSRWLPDQDMVEDYDNLPSNLRLHCLAQVDQRVV